MSQQLWDEGSYSGVLRTIQFTESGKSGSPQVEATFLVEGAIKKCFWSLSGGAEEYTLDKLRTVGWNGDAENPECSIGNEQVPLTCKHDEYQGKVREKWDIAGGGKPMDKDRARNIAAKFKSTAGVQRPASAPPKPSAAPQRSAAPSHAPQRKDAPRAGDKDEAWSVLASTYPNVDENKFYQAVDRVAEKFGKGELAFGPEQWTDVVNEYIPL